MAFQKVVVVTWKKLQWCHGKSYIRDMANAMKNTFCHGKVVLNFRSGEKVVKHFFHGNKNMYSMEKYVVVTWHMVYQRHGKSYKNLFLAWQNIAKQKYTYNS